jgi:hypothetical protein
MHDVTIERLLRGELAALETYEQALQRAHDASKMGRLTAIRNDHAAVAEQLRRLLAHGDHDDRDRVTTSGPWGKFAKATEGVATLIGDRVALRALKAGEDHGVKLYEKALGGDALDPEAKTLIREAILPKSHAHIEVLEELLDT